MSSYEHWDVSSAQRTGYASYQNTENRDTPENRMDYIDDHLTELVAWLRLGNPDILDEFIEYSGQACMVSYRDWLN